MRKRILWLIIIGPLFFLLNNCGKNNLPPGTSFYETEVEFATIDWAPDSKRVVGASWMLADGLNLGKNPSEIYVWEPGSQSYLQVSDHEFSLANSHPVWHPKLEQILYYSQTEFGDDYNSGVVDVTSKERQGIVKLGSSMDWLPNGSIFVVSNGVQLFLVDVATGVYESIWQTPESEPIRDLAVSPNGENVAIFSSDRTPPVTVWLVNIDDGLEQLIFTSEIPLSGLSWSADGQWLISTRRAGYNNIIAIKSDGSCMTDSLAIQENIVDVSWSPNGQQIAAVVSFEKTGVFLFDIDSQLIQDWLSSGTCSK